MARSRVGFALLVALFAVTGLAGAVDGAPATTAAPEPDAWVPTKPLDSCTPASPSCEARSGHAAVLLETGKVLVVGGMTTGPGGATPVSTAQLYDAARGTWSPTGSMDARRREGFTATLLGDGKVLVLGGNSDVEPDAEVYDPAAGKWAAVASPGTKRGDHTATLLPDGQVLVVGGGSLGTDSAEIYNPVDDSWSPTAALLGVRYDHVALPLGGGRVLIAGGWSENYGPKRSSVEIYNPDTGAWAPAAPLPYAPAEAVATAVEGGQAMVAGGIAGENTRGDPSPEVALYDPKTDTWTAKPTGTGNIAYSLTPLPDGKVLMMGEGDEGEPKADVFDSATGAWTPARLPDVARGLYSATPLPTGPARFCGEHCGAVLVAGGTTGTDVLALAELYVPPGAVASTTTKDGRERPGTAATSKPIEKESGTRWPLVAGGLAVVALAGAGLAARRKRQPSASD